MISADELDRRIRIEEPVPTGKATTEEGDASQAWRLVAETWAGVVDVSPARERLTTGITVATRSSRVRIRHREGITAAMRVLVGRYVRGAGGEREWRTDRIAEITTTPAEIGRRDGLEFMIEDFSSGAAR